MKKASLWERLAAVPYMVWALVFVLAPLVFVVYYSFTDKNGLFTLQNFITLTEPMYMKIFVRSISFALIATLICLVIAYPLAYFISAAKPNVQKMLILLTMLPMWMNLLIRTYSWMTILEDTGIINTLLTKLGFGTLHMINTPAAVILGMVYNFLPYMILPIYSVMTKLDRSLVEAAADLGCSSLQITLKIVLPLSVSGVISGITMVFVPSVSTFYISQKLGGGNFDLIGDTIERQFKLASNYNLGAAISLVMMVLILACMSVMNKFSDDDGGIVV